MAISAHGAQIIDRVNFSDTRRRSQTLQRGRSTTSTRGSSAGGVAAELVEVTHVTEGGAQQLLALMLPSMRGSCHA